MLKSVRFSAKCYDKHFAIFCGMIFMYNQVNLGGTHDNFTINHKNYRNLKDIDICLGETVVLIGENNSGKSNLLRAVILPFLTDESSFSGKSLSWIDINDAAKEKYYHYIIEN